MTPQSILETVYDYFLKTGKPPRAKDAALMNFTKYEVKKHFKTWSNMLTIACVPLNRNKSETVSCEMCSDKFKRQVKELRKSNKHFCGQSCASTYYNLGKKHSTETKKKISESLKAHRIFQTSDSSHQGSLSSAKSNS